MISNLFITGIFYLLIPKTNTNFDYFIMGYMIIPFLMLIKNKDKFLSKSWVLLRVFLIFIFFSGIKDSLLLKSNIELTVLQESIFDLILITMAINPLKIYEYVKSFLMLIQSTFRDLKNKTTNLMTLEEIDRMDDGVDDKGRGFELYIAQVFRKGKFKAFTTDELKEKKDMPASILERGGRGEQGCDNIIWFKKKIKIHGKVCDGFLVQAKRYKGNVSNDAPREAYGAIPMYEKHFKKKLYPIVVTNSNLTPEGYDLAKSQDTLVVDRGNIIEFFYQASKGKIMKLW